MVRRLAGARGQAETLTNLRVFGRPDGEAMEVLDLIEFRMMETAELELNAARVLPYHQRRAALRSAWDRRRGEIQATIEAPP